ncbi:MAG TPA: ABC transporter substrate-binding protein [Methylomirabilota bacterium]|nr:ABC transporter substrate-binding protein [Methylomirabilota bacterium]
MSKRWGTVASMVTVMALAAVAAVAWAQAPAKLIRLTFYYPVGVAGPLAKVIGEMTDKFNKDHPGIEVVPVYSGDYDPTLQKVQTAVMAGNPPDVFIVEISELPTLLAMNAIIPLDDYVRKAEGGKYWEDFFPAFRENSILRGKIWWIPFQRSTPVLYWNKDLFKKAGLDPDKAPQSWAELKDVAKKLTVREGSETKQWGVTVSGGWNDWLFEAFVRQNGAWLINPEGTKVNFASKEAEEALDFWVDLMYREKVGPPHSTWGSTPPDFVAGRTAMLYHSTGILTFLRNSAKFDFGVAFMPKNKTFGAEVGGGNLAISRKIPKERQDAAWKFLEWMTSTENAALWSIASGYIATRQSAYNVPALKEFVAKDPRYLVAREQLKYASGKMMAPNFQKIREILKRQLDDAVDGKLPPAAALAQVQQQVEAVIKR